MATNPQARRALIDQIPTEEDRQAPAAQPQSGIHSSELGRQVYNTAMALPGIGGVGKVAQTGGLVSRALNATAGAANKLATGTAALATLPAGAQSAPSTPSVPSRGAAATGTGTAQTPDTNTAAPQTEEPARQVAPGIYRVGNSYAGTGEAAVSLNNAPRGVPSAQNMAAADQLAANQQKESADRVARSSQPQVQPQSLMGRVTATHSGNDWTTRENLRRLKMDATSLIHQSAWAPKGSGQAAQHAYANAAAADLAAMSGGQGVTQYEGQRAAMPFNPGLDPMKGVAGAATMGAVLGGATGAGTSLLTHQNEPVRKPSEDLGLNPDNGPISRVAANAVDEGRAAAPAATPQDGLSLVPEEQAQPQGPTLAQRMDALAPQARTQPAAAVLPYQTPPELQGQTLGRAGQRAACLCAGDDGRPTAAPKAAH